MTFKYLYALYHLFFSSCLVKSFTNCYNYLECAGFKGVAVNTLPIRSISKSQIFASTLADEMKAASTSRDVRRIVYSNHITYLSDRDVKLFMEILLQNSNRNNINDLCDLLISLDLIMSSPAVKARGRNGEHLGIKSMISSLIISLITVQKDFSYKFTDESLSLFIESLQYDSKTKFWYLLPKKLQSIILTSIMNEIFIKHENMNSNYFSDILFHLGRLKLTFSSLPTEFVAAMNEYLKEKNCLGAAVNRAMYGLANMGCKWNQLPLETKQTLIHSIILFSEDLSEIELSDLTYALGKVREEGWAIRG